MIRVRVSSGEGERALELDVPQISIGRGDENQIKIDDKKSSRRHALIEVTGESVTVKDLDSRNGTCLNANRIQSAALNKGDVIRIGGTVITIDDLPSSPTEAPVQLQSVPVEDKVQVKVKIEEARKAIRLVESQRATAVFAKIAKRLAMTGIPVLLVVGVVIAITRYGGLMNDAPGAPGAKQPAEPKAQSQVEARAELDALREQVGTAAFPTNEHIARCLELQSKYADVWMTTGGKDDPFQSYLVSLYAKQAEYFNQQLEAAGIKVTAALQTQQYAVAIESLVALSTSTQGQIDARITELRNEVESAARKEFDSLASHGDDLARLRRYDEIRQVFEEALHRFKGTECYSEISSKSDLARLTEETERQKALAKSKKYEWPVEPKPAEVASKQPSPSETNPNKEAPVTPSPQTLNKIQQLLADSIANKRITRIKMADGKWVTPAKAEPSGIEIEGGTLTWSDLGSKVLADVLMDIAKDDDLLALAQFCHASKLESEAAKALFKYVSTDVKSRKPTTEDMIAAWKGLSAPPEGGYEYNAKLERWVDVSEKKSADGLAKVKEYAQNIARATSALVIDDNFKKAITFYNDPAIRPETKTQMKQELLAAIKAQKEKRMDEIKKRSSSGVDPNMSAQVKMLEDRRKECLRVMYDTNIYYPEGHQKYNEGLKEYRKVRDALLEVWDGKMSTMVDSTLRDAVTTVNRTNDEYLKQLGETVSSEDLKGLEEVMSNATAAAALTIRRYTLTSKQREIYNYNDRVEKYNNTTFKQTVFPSQGGGAPATIIQEANVLNGYREALGRRKLFLEARLVRAAYKHTQAMSAAGKIWHVGSDGNPQSRTQAEGFSGGVGENCSMGYASPDFAHKGWDEASDHCRNQCSDAWNCIGVGNVAAFWCQDFGNTGIPSEMR